MNRPAVKPIDPATVAELARGVVASDRFPQLATVDGDQPRLCSDKRRTMLHELAEEKRSMGFDKDGSAQHNRRYAKLEEANE